MESIAELVDVEGVSVVKVRNDLLKFRPVGRCRSWSLCNILEFGSGDFSGIGFAECSGYGRLELRPRGISALSVEYGWLDPAPSVAPTPSAGVVDLASVAGELVPFTIELELALGKECSQLMSVSVE